MKQLRKHGEDDGHGAAIAPILLLPSPRNFTDLGALLLLTKPSPFNRGRVWPCVWR